MKITSRPIVQQPCEPIVLKSIQQLYNITAGDFGPFHVTPNLSQYTLMVKQILQTLLLAGIVKDFKLPQPVEAPTSTFESEKWVHRIGFSGDGKEWYTLELNYNFTRAVHATFE